MLPAAPSAAPRTPKDADASLLQPLRPVQGPALLARGVGGLVGRGHRDGAGAVRRQVLPLGRARRRHLLRPHARRAHAGRRGEDADPARPRQVQPGLHRRLQAGDRGRGRGRAPHRPRADGAGLLHPGVVQVRRRRVLQDQHHQEHRRPDGVGQPPEDLPRGVGDGRVHRRHLPLPVRGVPHPARVAARLRDVAAGVRGADVVGDGLRRRLLLGLHPDPLQADPVHDGQVRRPGEGGGGDVRFDGLVARQDVQGRPGARSPRRFAAILGARADAARFRPRRRPERAVGRRSLPRRSLPRRPPRPHPPRPARRRLACRSARA